MGYLGLDVVMKVASTILIDYGLWIITTSYRSVGNVGRVTKKGGAGGR